MDDNMKLGLRTLVRWGRLTGGQAREERQVLNLGHTQGRSFQFPERFTGKDLVFLQQGNNSRQILCSGVRARLIIAGPNWTYADSKWTNARERAQLFIALRLHPRRAFCLQNGRHPAAVNVPIKWLRPCG